jgi:hypothetical protein
VARARFGDLGDPERTATIHLIESYGLGSIDRALKSAEAFDLSGPVDRWNQVRREIQGDGCANGVDPERKCFVQRYGAKDLDASLLLLPAVGSCPQVIPGFAAPLRQSSAS